jgi:SNF2 family DNA or RNA helicase
VAIEAFNSSFDKRKVLFAQPHAGGFGLNLQTCFTAVYLSNDYSYSTRVQSEDRMHRAGQKNACLYVDLIAVGPAGQKTVDISILEALRDKKSVADWTTSQWRHALAD